MRTTCIIFILLIPVLFSGCASIVEGKKDTLQIDVSNCNKTTRCVASNKKGEWDFRAPGPVTFTKSDDQLIITCEDGDEVITRTVKPTRGSMVWGNVLLGGIIGGAVDASSDAHWEMVDSVLISRNNCGSGAN